MRDDERFYYHLNYKIPRKLADHHSKQNNLCLNQTIALLAFSSWAFDTTREKNNILLLLKEK